MSHLSLKQNYRHSFPLRTRKTSNYRFKLTQSKSIKLIQHSLKSKLTVGNELMDAALDFYLISVLLALKSKVFYAILFVKMALVAFGLIVFKNVQQGGLKISFTAIRMMPTSA